MTILHVTPCLAPAWAYGRIAQDVHALARAQAAAGHRVLVLTTDALAPHERLVAGDAVVDDVHVVRVRNLTGAVRTWLDLSSPRGFARHARRLLAEHPVDIVHLHELATVENVAVLGVVPTSTPVVVSPHDEAGLTARRGRLRAHWDRRVLARVCHRAAGVIGASHTELEAAARAWRSAGCATPRRTALIPNGATRLPGADSDARRTSDAPIILWIGRLSTPTPLASLLPTVAELRRDRPAVHLHVVGGDHGGRAEADALAHTLGIASAVTWLGHVSLDSLGTHLAHADVVALPAGSDPYGDLSVSALAAGTTVVVDTHEGNVRADDQRALTPTNGSVVGWRDAFIAHLDAHGQGDTLRETARATAARCTWPAVATAMIEEYQAVATHLRA